MTGKTFLTVCKLHFWAVIVTLFCIFPVVNSVAAASSSIGVSPSQISNSLLVPGAEYDAVLTVSRATAVDEVTAKVEIFGPEILTWISFPNGTSAVLTKGEQRKEMLVRIKVPADAKLGKYMGSLRFTIAQEVKGQVNIVPGVRVDIELEVTERVSESVKIQYVTMAESAFGKPYSLMVRVNNTGNVPTSPTKLVLAILDINEKQLRELEYTFTEKVAAFQSKDFSVLVPDTEYLPLGEYWARVKIFSGSQEIYSEKISFRIGAAEVLTPTPTVQVPASSGLLYGIFAIVGIFILLGIIGIFFAFKKKNNEE